MELIHRLLEENMTPNGYKLWRAFFQNIPPVWDRQASSSGKYHKKENGKVPTISEHTYEMLYAANKLLRLFNIFPRSEDADMLLLAIVLHDAVKYGKDNTSKHTVSTHDKLMADIIKNKSEQFLKLLSKPKLDILIESVRYHSGRWSTDADNTFKFEDLSPFALFVHFLDMMSSRNLVKVGG